MCCGNRQQNLCTMNAQMFHGGLEISFADSQTSSDKTISWAMYCSIEMADYAERFPSAYNVDSNFLRSAHNSDEPDVQINVERMVVVCTRARLASSSHRLYFLRDAILTERVSMMIRTRTFADCTNASIQCNSRPTSRSFTRRIPPSHDTIKPQQHALPTYITNLSPIVSNAGPEHRSHQTSQSISGLLLWLQGSTTAQYYV